MQRQLETHEAKLVEQLADDLNAAASASELELVRWHLLRFQASDHNAGGVITK